MAVNELVREQCVRAEYAEPVSALLGRLQQAGAREAFVFREQQYVGMFDPLKLLRSRVDTARMRVAAVTDSAPRLAPGDSLMRAARLFAGTLRTQLPVIDGGFVGCVRAVDVLEQVCEQLPGTVGDAAQDVPVVAEEDRLGVLIERLSDARSLLAAVVGRQGRVVGFVSVDELLAQYYAKPYRRDRGQKPRQASRAFRAELPDILALPVRSFMRDARERTAPAGLVLSQAAELLFAHPGGVLVTDKAKPAGRLEVRDALRPLTEPAARKNIFFTHLSDLPVSEYTKREIKRICAYHSEKLSFLVKNRFDVRVHFKVYSKTGGRHKFSVNVRVEFPSRVAASTNAHDWDVRTAVHKAFADVHNQLSSRFSGRDRGLAALK